MGQHDSIAAEIPLRLGNPSTKILRSDATYLITGGTGGIGRGLASWMVENGAANVVLLGRSGSSNPKVADLIKSYEHKYVRITAIACDIGSRTDLVGELKAIEHFPKVRGVVHGALYLRVCLCSESSPCGDPWEPIFRIRMPCLLMLLSMIGKIHPSEDSRGLELT